jgi:hypothetical protein
MKAWALFISACMVMSSFLIWGCATSATTLQSARTLEQGEVQITVAGSVPVSTLAARKTIESAKSVVNRLKDAKDAAEPPTEEEIRLAVETSTAYVLFTPSVYPEALVRVGIVERFDAGLKLSYSLVKVEAKGQFLELDNGLAGSAFIGYGYHFGVGPSIASKIYDIFDYLGMVDYSRHDLDLGVLFGFERGEWLSFYGGPRYLLSFTNVSFKLKGFESIELGDLEDDAFEVDTPIHHVGAVVGVMLGYKYVFVNLELTLLYAIFKPSVLDETIDLSGMLITPAFGLTARF